MGRRPFDPRLLRRVPAVRLHLAGIGLLGGAAAAVVVGQAVALATTLAAAAEGRLAVGALLAFLAAVAGRAGWIWLSGLLSARTAARVKQELRGQLATAIARRGPAWSTGRRAGELATLLGRGLDGLDTYLTGYLPQLVLSVTVPVAVLAQLVLADWSSAAILAVTLPLVPVFGMLVGWQTRAATERQWRRLSRLGGHFLDMVTGLTTLRVFGRAGAQAAAVRRMADAHRRATIRTLRIAFLSALVLELLAAVAVALVAVPVGLRLLAGGLTLQTALLVLFLVPEAFLPLRTAGARFHASVEGLTALDEAFTALSEPPAGPGAAGVPAPASTTPTTPTAPAVTASGVVAPALTAAAPTLTASTSTASASGASAAAVPAAPVIEFRDVTVAYPRGTALHRFSLVIEPGTRVAVVGPSGAGKSTLLQLLLGFVPPTEGRILVDGVDLSSLDLEQWRRRLAWVPQRPHLFAASLRDNLRLGAPDATEAEVRAAVAAADLTGTVADLPAGLDTMLGERGQGLSSGQRRRVALARAWLRDAPTVLLDEPSAGLDTATEAAVRAAAGRLLTGRTAVLVAHRPALLELADRVIRLEGGRLTADAPGPGRLAAAVVPV